MDGLDVVAGDLELDDFVGAQLALLDEAVAGDDDEELPLGVVPMLTFGDSGLADVNGDLAAIEGVDQLGEGAAVIDIHLEREGDFLLGQVAEVGAVELLGKGALRDFRNHQGLRLFCEGLEEFHNLAQGDVMGDGAVAVAAIGLREDVEAFELAMLLLAFQAGNHLVHQVIDIEELQLHAGVVDGIGQVVGEGVAEGGHSTVVVGAAPFAKEVGEAVNQDLRASLMPVLQEEVLAGLLAAAVFGVAKTAGEAGLLAAGEHHRESVVVLLQGIEQGAGKAKVPLHELLLVLRTVHACQVEHEVRLLTPSIQLLWR